MDHATRTTLQLFIEMTERMMKYISENYASTGLLMNPGGLLGTFRNAEDEEWQLASTLDGVLVTFRLFVQPRDNIALYPLGKDKQGQPLKPKLLDLPGLSPEWYACVEQAYQHIDLLLTFAPPYLDYNEKPITRRQVLETFLYGNHVHVNEEPHEIYNQWRSDKDLFGMLQSEFTTIIVFILDQI